MYEPLLELLDDDPLEDDEPLEEDEVLDPQVRAELTDRPRGDIVCTVTEKRDTERSSPSEN